MQPAVGLAYSQSLPYTYYQSILVLSLYFSQVSQESLTAFV